MAPSPSNEAARSGELREKVGAGSCPESVSEVSLALLNIFRSLF